MEQHNGLSRSSYASETSVVYKFKEPWSNSLALKRLISRRKISGVIVSVYPKTML